MSYLCALAGASRSGYYSWIARPKKPLTEDERKVIDLFYKKNQIMGYRRLKMEFERRELRIINTKKIRRIKSSFSLRTKIRKRSKYKAIFAAGEEHSVAPNIVRRNFQDWENIVISIDLTELRIRNGQKTWFFAAKEATSNEIVASALSATASPDFVHEIFEDYLKSLPVEIRTLIIVHSDQGVHFTNKKFRSLLVKYGVRQSMSRKGNCLDNAPIESFFGHMKDEVDYKSCKRISDLRTKLKKYIDYYNYERPQWGLKQKTPAEAGVEFSLFY